MVKSVADKIDTRALLPEPNICPYCHSSVTFTSHAVLYGGRTFSDWPYIYLCDNQACLASVSVHAGTRHPLGTLADAATKAARKNAHAAFDPIWKNQKNKGKARTEAYAWLAKELDIEVWRCHISWFDVSYCKAVIKAVMRRASN